MEPLWTPWRMSYILGIKDESGCVLCGEALHPAQGTDLMLHRGGRAFVVLNLYPYTTGHLMVVPYRHVAGLPDLDREERTELADLLRRAERAVEVALGAQTQHVGLNAGRCAGAGVEGHLHLHLVPAGSTPVPPQDTSEPPEPLSSVRERLLHAWARVS